MLNIFAPNQDISKTAYLNWTSSNHQDVFNILVLGEGYINSADELIKLCLSNNTDKKADTLILPILFNLNHGIELYLKAILHTTNILSNSENLEEANSLEQLYQIVSDNIKYWLGKDEHQSFEKKLNVVKEYIYQFSIEYQSNSPVDLNILYCFVKNINRVLKQKSWLYCSQLKQ